MNLFKNYNSIIKQDSNQKINSREKLALQGIILCLPYYIDFYTKKINKCETYNDLYEIEESIDKLISSIKDKSDYDLDLFLDKINKNPELIKSLLKC